MFKRFFIVFFACFMLGCASGKNARVEPTTTGQYSTLGNNTSKTTKIETVGGDFVEGNKIVRDNEETSKEQIRVKLQVVHIKSSPNEWDKLKVDVINIGDKKVVLEKAYLSCNGVLMGTYFLKHPIDKAAVNWDYIKLEPGEKYDDIVRLWDDPQNANKYISWNGSVSWKGKTEVKIETTRGSTFTGFIDW